MSQEKEMPKILLLRKRQDAAAATDFSAHWGRLGKALKTFTDLEDREIDSASHADLMAQLSSFSHIFLDAELCPWTDLQKLPISNLTVVFPESFAWNGPETRAKVLGTLAFHPTLVLEALSTGDMVRVLHLYLMPKRLSGVTPLMEKGSLIVGEKVMDTNNIGSLLDRLSAFLELVDGLEVKLRIPDLRQVLTGLLYEALRCSAGAKVAYPFVDFQASASKKKLGVNLRFPRGGLNFDRVIEQALSGSNLFWHQIWQCSDVTVLTYHKQHEELEVSLLLCSPNSANHARFQSFLHKTNERSGLKENLLEAPASFVFKLLSDIRPQESEQIYVSEGGEEIGAIDLGALPENVARKLNFLEDQHKNLNDQIQKKDAQIQDLIRKHQDLNREIGTKRSELLRAIRAGETSKENSEKKIRELEARIDVAKKESAEFSQARISNTHASGHDALAKFESMLRVAENEKSQLRETVTLEQKRVASLEQKYSLLHREISVKEREINDLKSSFSKMRKEQANKQSAPVGPIEGADKNNEKIREVEEREAMHKLELRKLSFKLESQEKNIKAIQQESAEKLKILDQKLKLAKAKEIEQLKKIDELTVLLKKAAKAA